MGNEHIMKAGFKLVFVFHRLHRIAIIYFQSQLDTNF